MKSDCYQISGIPVIRGNNITDLPGFFGEFVFISEEKVKELESSRVYKDDLVFPHRGNIGEVGIITGHQHDEYIMSSSLMKLTCNKKVVTPWFLYYFFKSEQGKRKLLENTSQVGTPGIATPLASLKSIKVFLPDIDEQKRIVDILFHLDLKISNLRKQNETLERIAQTLFKHWFVDFEFPNEDGKPYKSSGGEMVRSESGEIPAGWQVRRFDSLGELNRGKSKHRPRYAEHLYGGKYPFIQTGDIKSSEGFITEYEQTYSESGLAQSRLWGNETLCITIAANIAETGILSFPSCFPDSVIGFVADTSVCDVYFIHRMFKIKRQEIENEAIGSVQKNLNLETISRIKFVIPDLQNHEDLVILFRKFGERIISNKQQIQTLSKTRDVLLPQLMSGKLRITE